MSRYAVWSEERTVWPATSHYALLYWQSGFRVCYRGLKQLLFSRCQYLTESFNPPSLIFRPRLGSTPASHRVYTYPPLTTWHSESAPSWDHTQWVSCILTFMIGSFVAKHIDRNASDVFCRRCHRRRHRSWLNTHLCVNGIAKYISCSRHKGAELEAVMLPTVFYFFCVAPG